MATQPTPIKPVKVPGGRAKNQRIGITIKKAVKVAQGLRTLRGELSLYPLYHKTKYTVNSFFNNSDTQKLKYTNIGNIDIAIG